MSFGLLLAAFVIALAIINIYQLVNYSDSEAIERFKFTSATYASTVNEQLASYQRVLKQISKQVDIHDALLLEDSEKAQELSIRYRSFMPDTVGLAIFSREGIILGEPPALQVGAACLQDLVEYINRSSLPTPFHSETPSLAHIDLFEPIMDGDEQIGILFLSVSIDVIQSTLERLSNEDTRLELYDAHHNLMAVGGDGGKNQSFETEVMVGEHGFRILAFAKNPLFSINRYSEIIYTLILMLVIMIVAIYLFSKKIIRRFLQELSHIRRYLKNISKGTLTPVEPAYYIETDEVMSEIHDLSLYIYEQNKELKITNWEKERLFSIIAHDLRNPFTPILGYAELLINHSDGITKDQIVARASNIKKSAENALDLLENLLYWSRVQTDHIKLEKERFNLNKSTVKVTELLLPISQSKNIVLKNDIPDLLEVVADQNSIGTVLRNLISNSIKFTESCGVITVGTYRQNTKHVVFVKDNGVGMTTEFAEKLFVKGEENSGVGTHGERGTGLGLLLCAELLLKQGEKIWVETNEEEGATFFFTVQSSRDGV